MALHRFLPGTKQLSQTLILAFAVLLLVGAAAVGAQDAGGNVLRVGANAPSVLDPQLNANDTETAFSRAMYDYLIDIQPDNTLAPDLASSWEVSDDNLTYTFHLEDGVTFHDGSPFTSADVIYSFNRLVEVESPATGLLGEFEVSAPDDATVVFTLPEINVDFLYGVGSRWAFILKSGEETPNTIVEGDNPYQHFNGTGPFKLQEFSPEQSATFVRNENYWREGQPMVDGLEFTYIEDSVAQVDALLGGDLDFIFRLSNDALGRLEGQDGINVIQVATAQHPVIRLRTDEGPGTDVNVRQAFKYATDREALNDVLLDGRGAIGNNDPISPAYADFFDADIENPTYDPEMSCQLLNEAGYPEGLTMTLFVPNNTGLGYPDMATLLQQQWEPACIHVTIEIREERLYYDDTVPDNYLDVELGITGWGSRPIPQAYLQEAYITGAPYNETHWSDSEIDALAAQARQTADTAARKDIYAQISQIFADRGPIVVPYFAPMIGATSARVQGLELNPYPGLTDYRTVSLTS
jgi:peptide/nickel transport system substrate-binding protein